ncbi:uncharacterized protein BT62DRAFT_834640, partial [Guyanagaster necrorhizus]
SLGLYKNVLFNFKCLKVLLQVHVVENTAYDILLERLFSILCETKIDNYANKKQILTIYNPNTGMKTIISAYEQ